MKDLPAESQAGELKESLAEEVGDVRQEVQQVSSQKEAAQQKLASLQKELDALEGQRKQIKVNHFYLQLNLRPQPPQDCTHFFSVSDLPMML